MSNEKTESLADVWGARYDDRDAEDLLCDRWSIRIGQREKAMAQPIRNFELPDEKQGDSAAPSTGHPK